MFFRLVAPGHRLTLRGGVPQAAVSSWPNADFPAQPRDSSAGVGGSVLSAAVSAVGVKWA